MDLRIARAEAREFDDWLKRRHPCLLHPNATGGRSRPSKIVWPSSGPGPWPPLLLQHGINQQVELGAVHNFHKRLPRGAAAHHPDGRRVFEADAITEVAIRID